MEKKWWHDKVAYQIYPKSFCDGNGDGIGDLQGIISRLDYLKELGVDIVWLSPIYKSPFVDQGYDIADYYAIAEEFGTMEEFDELLAEAKKRCIRNMVEAQVDFTKSRNVIVAAIILVCALGISLSDVGSISFKISGLTISLSGLAVASLVGIILNALFPDKDETQEIKTQS